MQEIARHDSLALIEIVGTSFEIGKQLGVCVIGDLDKTPTIGRITRSLGKNLKNKQQWCGELIELV